MSVKYSIEYLDVVGNVFVCEIDNDEYEGEKIILDGNCVVTAASVNNHFDPIRGKSMQINVTASVERPLSDLWQDDDFYWRTVLKRNGTIEFVGFLTSDGFFEDYNVDKWEISLESTGVLGVLNDLAYVQLNGNPYSGNESMIRIIANCLKRSFNDASQRMKIMAFSDLTYDGEPFFETAYIDQSIYLDDNGENYESCFKVVGDICESTGCVIMQEEGRIFIFPPHFLAQGTSLKFSEFDTDGNYVKKTIVRDLTHYIGSKGEIILGNAIPFHCSLNQQISRRRSTDVFIVRNNHELDPDVMPNSNLNFPEGDPGNFTNVNNWYRRVAANEIDFLPSGVNIYGQRLVIIPNRGANSTVALISPYVEVEQGAEYRVELKVEGNPRTDYYYTTYLVVLLLPNGKKLYPWPNEWREQIYERYIHQNEQDGRTISKGIPPIPENGKLHIEIDRPLYNNNWSEKYITIRKASLIDVIELDTEATEATFRRTPQKKGRAGETTEIKFNTGISAKQKNLLKDSTDNLIPSISSMSVKNKSLLYYVTFNRASYLQRSSGVFSGNVFGKVPLMGINTYTGYSSFMFPLEWSYDTARNITYLKCALLFYTGSVSGEIKETLVFSNTIKPTIEA